MALIKKLKNKQMKTIISIVEANVIQQPFLTQMLVDELVNLSSLARKLKPLIDSELHTDVKIGSVVMALKRLTSLLQGQVKIQSKKLSNIYGDLTVQLNLCVHTFENSKTIILAHRELLDRLSGVNNLFHAVSRGIYETTIVISEKYDFMLEEVFKNEIPLIKVNNLSSITIKLAAEYANTPGVYHLIFSKLAWLGISVKEVFSTTFEISIFIADKDTALAFTCIKDLFVQKKPHINQHS
ncbi:MAG TPA: aspartate kinase [Bacteroidales bacterium]|nr:aspartate kinase [Bacteroidales bacterium]